jgi:hypothetical protein
MPLSHRNGWVVFGLRRHSFLGVAVWIAGLAVGFVSAALAGHFLFSWMRRYEWHAVSIVLWLTAGLPFLISAFAVIYYKQHVVYIAAFLQTFLFSLVGQTLRLSFGTAGWLIQPIFQGCFLGLLACFYLYLTNLRKENALLLCTLCLAVWAGLCLLDQWLLQPYLQMLWDYSMGR